MIVPFCKYMEKRRCSQREDSSIVDSDQAGADPVSAILYRDNVTGPPPPWDVRRSAIS
jgi:hypothetical protein